METLGNAHLWNQRSTRRTFFDALNIGYQEGYRDGDFNATVDEEYWNWD